MAQTRLASTSTAGKRKDKHWECPYCQKTYPDDIKCFQCDTCESWVCLPCTKVPEEMYDLMHKLNDRNPAMNGFKWVCKLDERSLPTLKDMNTTLVSIKETNNERFDAIERQVKDIEGSIGGKVADKVSNLKEQLRIDLSAEMEERSREESDRKFREMNLCLFNVPLCTDKDTELRKTHDKNIVNSLFQAVVKDDKIKEPQIKNLYRLKKPKPLPDGSGDRLPVLKITFVNKHELRLFVTNSRSIKDNKDLDPELQKVIVSRDLSFKQREVNKKLREELTAKNKEEPDKYTIRNGRVVPKGKGATGPATPSE